tara:strand:- start:293 stop:505 length:213 start_codon:yes stop_codon:yes gene_type:complete
MVSRIIDIHAYVVLPETFSAAGKYGPELGDENDLEDIRILQDHSRIVGVMKDGVMHCALMQKNPYIAPDE